MPQVESAGERERRDETVDLTETLLEAAKFYRARLKEAPAAIDYLKRRGLTGAVAAHFGIGYAPDGWQNLAAAFPRLRRTRTRRRGTGRRAARGASATTGFATA